MERGGGAIVVAVSGSVLIYSEVLMESSGVKQVLTMLKRLSFKWFVTCYLTPSQLCRLCEQNILREKISSSIFFFFFIYLF